MICDSDLTVINLSNMLVGESPGGTWIRTSGIGGLFNAVNRTFTAAAGATSSTFAYTVSGSSPCVSDSGTVTINIISELSFPDGFPDIIECEVFILPPLYFGSYYTAPDGGGELLAAGTPLS